MVSCAQVYFLTSLHAIEWKRTRPVSKNATRPKSLKDSRSTHKRQLEPRNAKFKMASLVRPGFRFYAKAIEPVYPDDGTLYRTASHYSHGLNLELEPAPSHLYVINSKGAVESAVDPSIPIGWELCENENGTFYRVSQVGMPLRPCHVSYVPDTSAYSREAAFHEAADDGEPEVTSKIKCPGAPRRPPMSRAEWEALEPFEMEWRADKE